MGKKLSAIFKPTRKKIIIAAAAVLAVILVIVGISVVKKNKAKTANSETGISVVDRGDVEVVISGSGTVEPYERYEVISSVQGDVLSAPYEIGDAVKKDDILYEIDSSDAQIDLQKQQNSLKQATLSNQESHKDLEKLTITAPCDGVITGLDVKKGDDVNNNTQIAVVTGTDKLKVNLPFNESQKSAISVGQTAELSSSAHMSTIYGTVTHIDGNPTAQSDGSLLYNVTVEFTNPGSFDENTVVGGSINGVISPGSGNVKYINNKTVSTETDGTITSVKYSNGDYVNKGAVIATLENDTITNSVQKSNLSYQDAQLSLDSKMNSLEDYVLTSPIDGTVLTKEYKVGDTLGKSDASLTMMVIGDISKLKFSLEIDELDVSKVKEGQSVEITCDAVENEIFNGKITSISLEGTASNGVTSYTAEVVIDEPGNLRPSMNVDASVIIESAENVLRLPTTDIKKVGNMSYVFVKDDGTSEKNKDNKENPENGMPNGEPPIQDGQKPQDTNIPQPNGEKPNIGENIPENENNKNSGNEKDKHQNGDKNSGKGNKGGRMPEAPEGFVLQIVTTGVSGDDYTEITGGLNEGDQVYQQAVSSSSNNQMTMGMPGGGGGMPGGGGGMPGGGGGMPGGGGPRG